MKRILKAAFCKIAKFITKEEFTVDVTGVILTPLNKGRFCLGNGKHKDRHGNLIECCCDECDYLMRCVGVDIDNNR